MLLPPPPRTDISEIDTWLEYLYNLLTMTMTEIRFGDDNNRYVSIHHDGLLESKGGRIENVTLIDNTDSPYTVLSTDEVIFVDTDTAAVTVNLPAGVAGTRYKVVNVGSSGNDITLDPNGTETLLGGAAGASSAITDGNSLDINYDSTEGWF